MINSILNNIDLSTVIVTILTGVITFIGAEIKSIYNKKVKNEIVREVVEDCVKYIEQKSKNEIIENKYDNVKQKVINILKNKGISISDDEIDLLIERFVNCLKKGKEGFDCD